MNATAKDPLAHLALADPKLSETLSAALYKRDRPLPPSLLTDMVALILKGISLEISFGETLARSCAVLFEDCSPEILDQFRRMVDEAAETGPALATLMASHSIPVLKAKDPALLRNFTSTIRVMQKKGVHSLYEPLACLSGLVASGDLPAANAFLDLLTCTFEADLPYGQTRYFAHALPKAVASFQKDRRVSRILQIQRLMTTDTTLVEFFLDGMLRGLSLLSEDAPENFVSEGLRRAEETPAAGRNFLSLSAGVAKIALETLQTAVSLDQARPRLERYLQARTGTRISVNAMSDLPASAWEPSGEIPMVCTDGRCLYLADIMDRHESQAENLALYRTLARLESAHLEFGTFDFDLERLRRTCPGLPFRQDPVQTRESGLEDFFALFPCPSLADDLFTVFEHGRMLFLTAGRYPGLVRRVMPTLEKEMLACFGPSPEDLRMLLYAGILLGRGGAARILTVSDLPEMIEDLCRRFEEATTRNPSVESMARLVFAAYPVMTRLLDRNSRKSPLPTPYGRRVRPALFRSACRHLEPLMDRLQSELEREGIAAFRSDIRRQLINTDGHLSPGGLSAILDASKSRDDAVIPDLPADLYGSLSNRLPDLFRQTDETPLVHPDTGGSVFWQQEWSHLTGEYLHRHVRLVEHVPPGHAEDIFDAVLNDYRGMVHTIRRAFELLKPQGLTLMRHWPDGEEIDLSALIAATVDRKAGRSPSDRLYSKRAKQVRDVTVTLLVDQSGSTKTLAPGTTKSVLSVEKEAIVLFCDALRVVGGAFSVAGFSGHGRLQVDYIRYKDFDEPVSRVVRRRISGMPPQRSTQTGAAIRHAAGVLAKRPSKVRLLILLGDGYPNDTGYKREYAVSDVRKAIAEAGSKGVHVRPITINLSSEKTLDSLHGTLHHNVISDVRELPDMLWRIYCALTR